MAAFDELFGSQLRSNDGSMVETAKALEGKVVGVYFRCGAGTSGHTAARSVIRRSSRPHRADASGRRSPRSAHWCPPCRVFTPKLVDTYGRIKADGKEFEIVFVSAGREEDSFKEYHGTMPWLAVPFTESARRFMLGDKYNAHRVPMLVLLDSDGSLITNNGCVSRSAGMEGGDGWVWPGATRCAV